MSSLRCHWVMKLYSTHCLYLDSSIASRIRRQQHKIPLLVSALARTITPYRALQQQPLPPHSITAVSATIILLAPWIYDDTSSHTPTTSHSLVLYAPTSVDSSPTCNRIYLHILGKSPLSVCIVTTEQTMSAMLGSMRLNTIVS